MEPEIFEQSKDKERNTFDGLQKIPGSLETSVGAVVPFWGKSHSCTIGATGASLFIVPEQKISFGIFHVLIQDDLRSAAVPRESQ